MQNIEIKYRLADYAAVGRVLKKHDDITHEYTHQQRDIYFNAPHCRLKIRIEDGKTPHLIEYRRPDQSTARISEFHLTELDNVPTEIERLRTTYGQIGEVAKQRSLYFYKNVRIHLDRVDQLGEFLEFESVISDECGHALARQHLDEITALLKPFLDSPQSAGYINLLLDPL